MNDDLFVSLAKHKPGKYKTPLENFVTEAFAWIIKNNQPFAKSLIQKILDPECNTEIKFDTKIKCTTQVNFDGVRPDMLIEFNDMKMIFEHKLGADLHPNQLANYKKYAEGKYTAEKHTLVLITATSAQHQHSDYANIKLYWTNICDIIKKWLCDNTKDENTIFLKFFLKLLEEKNLKPTDPVEYAAILHHNKGRKLQQQIDGFLLKVEGEFEAKLKSWPKIQINKTPEYYYEYYPSSQKHDKPLGQYGFYVCGREKEKWKWNPCLFIGFLLDHGEYTLVEPIDGTNSPDFALSLYFGHEYRDKYPHNKVYKEFKNDIKSILLTTNFKWDIYDIEEHDGEQNEYYPIHLRVPMRKIFAKTKNIDEQVEKFFKYIEDILPKIIALPSLQKLKEEEFK